MKTINTKLIKYYLYERGYVKTNILFGALEAYRHPDTVVYIHVSIYKIEYQIEKLSEVFSEPEICADFIAWIDDYKAN